MENVNINKSIDEIDYIVKIKFAMTDYINYLTENKNQIKSKKKIKRGKKKKC